MHARSSSVPSLCKGLVRDEDFYERSGQGEIFDFPVGQIQCHSLGFSQRWQSVEQEIRVAT
jgi:hypothetical protein